MDNQRENRLLTAAEKEKWNKFITIYFLLHIIDGDDEDADDGYCENLKVDDLLAYEYRTILEELNSHDISPSLEETLAINMPTTITYPLNEEQIYIYELHCKEISVKIPSDLDVERVLGSAHHHYTVLSDFRHRR